MAYTVFDDDVEHEVPQNAVKFTPKKSKTPTKLASGHAEPGPVASTSKAILPPEKRDSGAAGPTDGQEAAPAIFKKKRRASIDLNGVDGKGKSRKRSPTAQDSPQVNRADLPEDQTTTASTIRSQVKPRETTPVVTSKRVANFYDDDVELSEEEEAGSPSKVRGQDVKAGESKKQARKRQQAERKDKAEHLLAARQKLPVYSVKDAILREIEERDTVVVLGETGSGKTTRECKRRIQNFSSYSSCA